MPLSMTVGVPFSQELGSPAGNFEDARYLLELAADADRQAEAHDQQTAPSEDTAIPCTSAAT